MAIPDHIKQQIIKNIDKKRDKTLSKLREVLDYPYHPDTKILIFRVEGDSGAYGMNLLAANEHWDMIEVNADGEDLYGTRFLHFGFSFYVLEDCDVSPARTSLLEQISWSAGRRDRCCGELAGPRRGDARWWFRRPANVIRG